MTPESRIRHLPWSVAVAGAVFTNGIAFCEVLVVDPASSDPTTFDTINAAVSAALTGDTIVIRDGEYDENIGFAKGLTLVADTNSVVRARSIFVAELPAGRSATIRGIDFGGGTLGPGTLVITDCAGPVWVEDCTFTSAIAVGAGGSLVRDSASVVISRCEFGAPATGGSSLPFATLTLVDSSTRIFETDVTGKTGGPVGTVLFATVGYPAVSVQGGRAAIEGGTLLGGSGGNWQPFIGCLSVGDGGPGLASEDGAIVTIVGALVLGGDPGSALGHACDPAAPGQAVVVDPGSTLNPIPGTSRSLSANSPARPGDTVTFTFSGSAGSSGDLLWLMLSPVQNPLAANPAIKPFSTFLALATPTIAFVGAPPTAPSFSFGVVVPPLPSGIDAANFALQAAWFDASVGVLLPGAPTLVTIVP